MCRRARGGELEGGAKVSTVKYSQFGRLQDNTWKSGPLTGILPESSPDSEFVHNHLVIKDEDISIPEGS